MKYVNKDDLTTIIQERLLNDSVALEAAANIEDNTIINNIEIKAIDLIISYISGIYDTDVIFDEASPIRNGVLVQVLSCIVVYRSVRRNAARKVPEDYQKLYDDAIKDLERIQSGVINLVNCPKNTKDDGSTGQPFYGNSTKDENFI